MTRSRRAIAPAVGNVKQQAVGIARSRNASGGGVHIDTDIATMDDPHDLRRFVEAQAPVMERVLRELGAGRKESHWMWFVFPQIAGLGHSPMARHYAIASLAEAEAYLRHELLGPRLVQCTDLVHRIESPSIVSILGRPDDLKFRSSMTLFSRATADNGRFLAALDKYFEGQPDPATIERL